MPKQKVNPSHEKLIREAVESWTSDIDSSLIRVRNVYTNRYRVDVFTKSYTDREFLPCTEIAASFFVAVVGSDVRDLTIQPKEL